MNSEVDERLCTRKILPKKREVTMQSERRCRPIPALSILILLLSQGVCSPAQTSGLSQTLRRRADQIISVFENGTTEIQYDYVDDLDDGRGITAGRAGFTSADGDLLIVVDRYVAQRPNSSLAPYLPRLRALAHRGSGRTDGLEGLDAAWAEAADDSLFRTIQDRVVDELYYQPAMAWGRKLGVKTPLGLTILYDTAIQHGLDTDPDGLPALIARTVKQVHGSPLKGVEEAKWLLAFLQVRRADLENADDPDTREEWASSVGRVDILRNLVLNRNWSLRGPLQIRPYGRAFVIL